ncbi:ATP-dependent Clp protease ATP-binding subunit, partial [Patescibacteria group bacterium]|nr:ATP-dependent Clp protease ATP-binding subunit [Patescibacteria group bacterium]
LNKSQLYAKVQNEINAVASIPAFAASSDKAKTTPILNTFGEDINAKIVKDNSTNLVYRSEVEKIISTLLLKEKSNVLLVGDAGVGKYTLTELLAHQINTLDVPPALAAHRVIGFDLLSFMTGLANRGGFDIAINSLIEELKTLPRAIVVLKNFQDIFFSSSMGLTVPIFYSILKSGLQDTKVKVIASLTPVLYEKISGENEHVIDNYTVIEVPEPGERKAKEIIKANAKSLGDYHKVEISDEMVSYLYTVSQKYLKTLKFPQKAFDLLDYACSYLSFRKSKIPEKYRLMVDKSFDLGIDLNTSLEAGKYEKAEGLRQEIQQLEKSLLSIEKRVFVEGKKMVLKKADIDKVLEDFTLGVQEIIDPRSLSFHAKLGAQLKKYIIGQDEAVDLISKALIRARIGLRSKKRPLGNFLFLGPTGVGKTELAKILAREAFSEGDYSGLIRLDMSDFSEKHTAARLVGAPPGYVGYGEGGELTSKIEAHPRSVVLFDEIEKAHPDVLNILLQIMEEGELTDAKGQLFDFSNALVILTSNLGTEILHNSGIGFEEQELTETNIENRLKLNLKKIVKPELINRFDEVVVFKRLSKAHQLKVLELLLTEISKNLKEQQVKVNIDTESKKWLLEKGYSREYGARSLRRTIEKELLDVVAQTLLDNTSRPLVLESTLVDKKLVINVISAKAKKI